MENSINFIHPLNTILTSSDGYLYRKEDNNWVNINQTLYKSEFNLPSLDIGNEGDYYAKYLRKYNYILFSEDFFNVSWNKNNVILNKESTLKFPNSEVTKIMASNELSEHSIDYIFYNKLRQVYTFSIYVQKNELQHLSLSFSNEDETYGYIAKFNLINNTHQSNVFGNSDDVFNTNTHIEVIDDNVVRLSITAQFNATLILKIALKLLDNTYNPIFKPLNNTFGLFINGAQLVESNVPQAYIISNGKYANQLILEQLFQKVNNVWKSLPNTIYYINDISDTSIGTNNDLACVNSIITLNPAIKIGNGTNISKNNRQIGMLRYNDNTKKWYVTTKRGDYSLCLSNPKPDFKAVAMAITLNQQTYQTYSRYGAYSNRRGINSGGNYNFWSRNSRL